MPHVSVAIPSFNHAAFLASAIRSILAQSCQDLDVLVIDDASTDDSFEIARSFESDSRVRCIRNETSLASPVTGTAAWSSPAGPSWP